MKIVIDRHNKAQMYDLLQAANGMRELYQRLNEYNTLDENNLNGSLGDWIQKINAAAARANPALVSLGMPTIETDIFKKGE